MAVYNEEDVLEQTLRYHIEEGVEFLVLDNGSVDRSLEIARSLLGLGVLGVRRIETATYSWAMLLDTLVTWAADYSPDWCLLVDADTFLESPWPNVGLLEGIRRAVRGGANVITFDNFEFWPTSLDDHAEPDVRRRLRHYTWADSRQEKAWKAHTGARNSRTGGHVIDLPPGVTKVVSPTRFVMRHYRIRSVAHGLRKVFGERLPRFQGEPAGWHVHYDGFGRTREFFEIPVDRLVLRIDGEAWCRKRTFHGWDPRILSSRTDGEREGA